MKNISGDTDNKGHGNIRKIRIANLSRDCCVDSKTGKGLYGTQGRTTDLKTVEQNAAAF